MAGNVKVTVNAAGMGEIKIDDFDLSQALRGFTLSVESGERPRLDLDFSISEVEVTAMGESDRTVLVIIPDAVVHTLLMLGWTPPENDTRTYRLPHASWEAIDAPALNERPTEYTPTRDEYCTCPEHHDPFQMDGHHSTCYYEQNSPDAND